MENEQFNSANNNSDPNGSGICRNNTRSPASAEINKDRPKRKFIIGYDEGTGNKQPKYTIKEIEGKEDDSTSSEETTAPSYADKGISYQEKIEREEARIAEQNKERNKEKKVEQSGRKTELEQRGSVSTRDSELHKLFDPSSHQSSAAINEAFIRAEYEKLLEKEKAVNIFDIELSEVR